MPLTVYKQTFGLENGQGNKSKCEKGRKAFCKEGGRPHGQGTRQVQPRKPLAPESSAEEGKATQFFLREVEALDKERKSRRGRAETVGM